MSREVFTPLRMDRTALEGTPLRRSGRQSGTDDDPDTAAFDEARGEERENEVRNPPVMDYSCTVGGGAFLSTPSDLVAARVSHDEPRAVESGNCHALPDAAAAHVRDSTGFALGWKVDSIPLAGAQVRVVRHRASLIAGAVSLYLFPDRGLVIAVTSNVPNTVAVEAFALHVAEAFISTR